MNPKDHGDKKIRIKNGGAPMAGKRTTHTAPTRRSPHHRHNCDQLVVLLPLVPGVLVSVDGHAVIHGEAQQLLTYLDPEGKTQG